MGINSDINWLMWQLVELKELLEKSKDSLLMKISLENRIIDTENRLEELKKLCIDEAKLSMLFSGDAVAGSKGIKATFTSKTLEAIQSLIICQAQINEFGVENIGRRGKLSKCNFGELYLTGLPHGSFGVDIELMKQEDIFAENIVSKSIKDIMNLIEATAKNQERYEELVNDYPFRMIKNLRSFFKEISSEKSILKMESGSNYLELSVNDGFAAYGRLSNTIMEERSIIVHGKYLGGFIESGKFEFSDEEGNTKHGRISEDIDENRIVYFNKQFSKMECKMYITQYEKKFKDGKTNVHYELNNIE